MTSHSCRITPRCLLFSGGIVPAFAQQDFSAVQIKPEQVAPGVYMLAGSGGNMSLLTGPDGAILVDDQYAPLTTKILAAVRGLTDKPLRLRRQHPLAWRPHRRQREPRRRWACPSLRM